MGPQARLDDTHTYSRQREGNFILAIVHAQISAVCVVFPHLSRPSITMSALRVCDTAAVVIK